MKRPRLIANISVATRLSLVALLVTLISLVVTAVVGLQRGNELADGLAEARLVTVSASRTGEIEGYVNNARRKVVALAASPATADAIGELGAAYAELNAQPLASSDSELTEYYATTLVPELEAVRGMPVGVTTLLPTQPAAVRLQTAYTVPKSPESGGRKTNPELVIDASDGSTYSELHAGLHPIYGGIAVQAGLDDLFLIDARNDTIVYSVRKRSDFATSLSVGPLSGSALANLIDGIARSAQPGSSRIADFSAYPPHGDQPIAFVASPVVGAGGDVVGYVVAGLSTATLNSLLTGSHAWDNLGESGETYLAGQDGTMRTNARPFVENPAAFLAVPDPESSGTTTLTDDQRRRIEETGTTALVQPVNRQVLTAAATGPGVVDTVNYLGEDVLTAYRAVDIEGVDWVVFTNLGAAESARSLEGYARDMLFAIAVFVVAVTFVAVGWANRIMAPVRAIASRIRAVRAGSGSVDAHLELPARSPDEYTALSGNIDDMLHRLGERRAEMTARSEERVALLREFLPATVVQRTEQGAGDVLDHADNATVAVLVLQGIGDLVARLGEQDLRDRLGSVIDELDALATEFGLERVKITGDSYFALCGVSRPYLDHAARSVGFALAAREVIAELDSESGQGIGLSCGVGSGPVSVGLTDRDGLVYDVWGPAVKEASELARHSPVGEIAISTAVRRQLQDDFVTADASDGEHAVVIRRAVPSQVSP